MKTMNNWIFCVGCRHTKMLFETQSKADNFIKFNRVSGGRREGDSAAFCVQS